MICKECAAEADCHPDAAILYQHVKELGHAACSGCDCQHKPVKDGQIQGCRGDLVILEP